MKKVTDVERLWESTASLKKGDRREAAVNLLWLRGKAHTRYIRGIARNLIELHNLEAEAAEVEAAQQAKGVY